MEPWWETPVRNGIRKRNQLAKKVCTGEMYEEGGVLGWHLVFSGTSTQLHACTWLLPQGLLSLRRARDMLESFPKLARLTG